MSTANLRRQAARALIRKHPDFDTLTASHGEITGWTVETLRNALIHCGFSPQDVDNKASAIAAARGNSKPVRQNAAPTPSINPNREPDDTLDTDDDDDDRSAAQDRQDAEDADDDQHAADAEERDSARRASRPFTLRHATPEEIHQMVDNARNARSDDPLIAGLEPILAPAVMAQIKARLDSDRQALEDMAARVEHAASAAARVAATPVPAGFDPAKMPVPTGRESLRTLAGWKPRQKHGDQQIQTWNSHGQAEAIDPAYQPDPSTFADFVAIAEVQEAIRVCPWLYGPQGTGKSSMARHYAAITGRRFVEIRHDMGFEAQEVIGQNLPDGPGAFKWSDGILTQAIRIPGTVILLDEPTLARPGLLNQYHNLFQFRTLAIKETGELVTVAPGVIFVAADNSTGTGEASATYTGTNQINAATIARFMRVEVQHLSEKDETLILAKRTGIPPEAAAILCRYAAETRVKASNDELTVPASMRDLVPVAILGKNGMNIARAMVMKYISGLPVDGREIATQLLVSTLGTEAQNKFAALVAGTYAAPAPTVQASTTTSQGARAAQAFTVTE